MKESRTLDLHEVMRYLPHRYPFLLIDRVTDYEPGKQLTALKNVTFNEPYFPGHFPNRAVMPGVLILEAMAQATGILAFITNETEPQSKTLYYLVGVDKARFKRPVEPGDQLSIVVNVVRMKRKIWVFETAARVGEDLVASAEIMCAQKELDS